VLDVPAGMRVRRGRRHSGMDVLVCVGDCCGRLWRVDSWGRRHFTVVAFQPKKKKGV
jgi:hypothetical protein